MKTFRELHERNCYYVDKTVYGERLLDRGKHYFLPRPHRFGKSLLLDGCDRILWHTHSCGRRQFGNFGRFG